MNHGQKHSRICFACEHGDCQTCIDALNSICKCGHVMARKDKFTICDEQLLAMIKIGVSVAGSQKALAAQMNISSQYLCDVLNGRRRAGQAVLNFYGLERVYRRIDVGS